MPLFQNFDQSNKCSPFSPQNSARKKYIFLYFPPNAPHLPQAGGVEEPAGDEDDEDDNEDDDEAFLLDAIGVLNDLKNHQGGAGPPPPTKPRAAKPRAPKEDSARGKLPKANTDSKRIFIERPAVMPWTGLDWHEVKRQRAGGDPAALGYPLPSLSASEEPLPAHRRPQGQIRIGISWIHSMSRWLVARTLDGINRRPEQSFFREPLEAAVTHDRMLLAYLDPQSARDKGLNVRAGVEYSSGRFLGGRGG